MYACMHKCMHRLMDVCMTTLACNAGGLAFFGVSNQSPTIIHNINVGALD